MKNMNFAIYYVGDGYSTDKKIMGRQNAGKTMMKGIARRWKTNEIHGFGARASGAAMLKQLQGDGFAGTLRWREAPGDKVLEQLGAVYFPGPVTKDIASARNGLGAKSYSLFGVTHTLSSTGAMDMISEMVLPPFRPWDALICTSTAALSVVSTLQSEFEAWFAEQTGATRFNAVATPVIPLGVNAPDFARDEGQIAESRRSLGVAPDDVVFLFAGRMTFHAKASPVPVYQALEEACRRTGKALVCMEAGVYPNLGMAAAYEEARRVLAPSVRFIQVDGQDMARYAAAWRAADVFVSLSDNIQETFGITPLEAMAAGIPVIVSDWDGYKDTVRDGVDGYRIPVVMPMPGAGEDLAVRHALGQDSYDYYIGRVSMTTAVDLAALTDRMVALAEDPNLRRSLGEAGKARVRQEYDWPVILDRYVDLVQTLGEIRRAAPDEPIFWPARPDPYRLFADYPTRGAEAGLKVVVDPERAKSITSFLDLGVAKYVLDPVVLPAETILELLAEASRESHTVGSLVGEGARAAARLRALMWLCKMGLLDLRP